jgi:hypothetical protein
VQRHASYEHRVLGDIPPDHLFALGAHTNLAGDPGAADVTVQGLNGAEKVTRANVVHVLDQELRRLRAWQSIEPKTTSMDRIGEDMDDFKQAVEAKAKEGHETDSEWNVRIVAIDSTVGAPPLLVTYGELNTLADFYGSVNELRAADPAKRRNVVQSVRQQSYQELLKIYQGVAGSGDQEALAEHKKMPEFTGAFNITGTSGEVGQMAVDKKGGSGTTAYTATLARNACHFAPESWHSWEDHHHKALQLAIQSHGTEDGNEKRKLANQALLYNGFGDHYLQDSYASGHLINKTKIMQMYVRHLDKHPPVTGSYTSDWTWRAFQSMAYRQEGLTATSQYDKGAIGRRDVGGKEVTTARNPQAVENTQEMDDFSWQNRFEMLGLKVPSGATPGTNPWKLLVWMQKQRGGFFGNRYTVTFAFGELQGSAKDIGLDKKEIGPALYRLVQDNIVYKTDDENGDESRQQAGERLEGGKVSSGGEFSLRKEWVVSITGPNEKNFERATAKGADPGAYNKMAQATVYKEYVVFMKDAYLQKATNAAHDFFCEQGLQVSSEEDSALFKIYGDAAMMNAESSAGLKESATTANMSRDAIVEAAATGAEPEAKSTKKILDRLPAYVVPPQGGERISLADWQAKGGPLEQWLGDNVFEKMNVAINLGMGVVGNLGKVTKDEDVHGGEAF